MTKYIIRLEVFNSIILHNLSDNPNLIYAILSSHKAFEDLGTFTLSQGLREIKRAQQLKEQQQARGPESNPKTRGSVESRDSSDPGAEKARLLNEEAATEEGEPEAEGETSGEGGNPDVTEEGSASDPASRRSEKARGKMKERRSLSVEDVGVAAASVGRNGFVPTQEWVRRSIPCSWHELMLHPGNLMAARVGFNCYCVPIIGSFFLLVYRWIACSSSYQSSSLRSKKFKLLEKLHQQHSQLTFWRMLPSSMFFQQHHPQ